MPGRTKQNTRNDPGSEGEDFSDVTSSADSDDGSLAPTHWTFPVVSHHAKREEYEAVSNSLHSSQQI